MSKIEVGCLFIVDAYGKYSEILPLKPLSPFDSLAKKVRVDPPTGYPSSVPQYSPMKSSFRTLDPPGSLARKAQVDAPSGDFLVRFEALFGGINIFFCLGLYFDGSPASSVGLFVRNADHIGIFDLDYDKIVQPAE